MQAGADTIASVCGHDRGKVAVGAVLLAAGAASRIGHRPKALLELDGEPLIRRQLLALHGAGIQHVVVVLGHYANCMQAALQGFAVNVVLNPSPDDGPISSLRLGLHASSSAHHAVLVALADQPLVTAHDITDLLDAFQQRPGGTQVVQPTVHGQPSNPVIFTAQVRTQILLGDAQMGCRQWQAAHPDQVHRWTTTNHHYSTDIDTPDDITTLARRTGQRLCWPAHLSADSNAPNR